MPRPFRSSPPLPLVALLVLGPAAAILASCDGDDLTGGGLLDRLTIEARATVLSDRMPGPAPGDNVLAAVQIGVSNPTGADVEILSALAVVSRAGSGKELWRFEYATPCAGMGPTCPPLMAVPPHGANAATWFSTVPEDPHAVCGEAIRVSLTLRGRRGDGTALPSRTVALPSATLNCAN